MSGICIYIDMDDYLRQWFVAEEGGVEPVTLRKGGIESKLLQEMLVRLPEGTMPSKQTETTVAILIPEYRYKPAAVYNHLTERGQKVLLNVIRDRFDRSLWESMSFIGTIGRRRDEMIYAWMEARGIETTEKNWNAIAKRYQRLRRLYDMRIYARERYKKNKKSLK